MSRQEFFGEGKKESAPRWDALAGRRRQDAGMVCGLGGLENGLARPAGWSRNDVGRHITMNENNLSAPV